MFLSLQVKEASFLMIRITALGRSVPEVVICILPLVKEVEAVAAP